MVSGFDVNSDAMLLLLLPAVLLSVGAEGDMVNAYVGMGAGGEEVLSASRVWLSSFGRTSIFGSRASVCCVGTMGADCVWVMRLSSLAVGSNLAFSTTSVRSNLDSNRSRRSECVLNLSYFFSLFCLSSASDGEEWDLGISDDMLIWRREREKGKKRKRNKFNLLTLIRGEGGETVFPESCIHRDFLCRKLR